MIIAKVMVLGESIQDLGSESCKFWGYNFACLKESIPELIPEIVLYGRLKRQGLSKTLPSVLV